MVEREWSPVADDPWAAFNPQPAPQAAPQADPWSAFNPQAAPAQQPSSIWDMVKSAPRAIAKGLTSFPRMASGAVTGEALSYLTPEQQQAALAEGEKRHQASEAGFEKAISGLPKPETAAGKFSSGVLEFASDPTGYIGPGGMLRKGATALAGGIGSEAAGELTEGTKLEGPARVAGGMLGAKVPGAVARPIPGMKIPPERQPYLTELDNADIPYTAGQATGSRALRSWEGHLGELPGAGGATERANSQSSEAFNKWALEQAGASGTKADQPTINRMWKDLGDRYDALAAKHSLTFSPADRRRVAQAAKDYSDLTAPAFQKPIVAKVVKDINTVATKYGGAIPGTLYQKYRSQIERAARGAPDPESKQSLHKLAETLDDAMENTLISQKSPDVGAYKALRRNYRAAKAIEAAIGTGERADDIAPNKLRNALSNQNKKSYQTGSRDMAPVTRAADKILNPLPQSGTAPRTAAMAIPTSIVGGAVGGGAAGGPVGAALGAAGGGATALAPGLAGRALLSGPVQRALKNQAPPPFPAAGKRAIIPGVDAASEDPLAPPQDGLSPGSLSDLFISSAHAEEAPRSEADVPLPPRKPYNPMGDPKQDAIYPVGSDQLYLKGLGGASYLLAPALGIGRGLGVDVGTTNITHLPQESIPKGLDMPPEAPPKPSKPPPPKPPKPPPPETAVEYNRRQEEWRRARRQTGDSLAPRSALPGPTMSDASPDPIRAGERYAMADLPPPPTGEFKPPADKIRPQPLSPKMEQQLRVIDRARQGLNEAPEPHVPVKARKIAKMDNNTGSPGYHFLKDLRRTLHLDFGGKDDD